MISEASKSTESLMDNKLTSNQRPSVGKRHFNFVCYNGIVGIKNSDIGAKNGYWGTH